jgi:hypothetical protein
MQRSQLALVFAVTASTACRGGESGDTAGTTAPDLSTGVATTGDGTGDTGVDPTTGGPTTGGPTTADPTTGGSVDSDDTGTVDTGTDDTSTGAPVACPPGFFCDDFEGHPAGAAPGAPWQADIGAASLAVEAGMAVSGSRAVHLQTGDAYGGRALLRLAVPEVFPTTHLFGRMRMRVTQASPDGVHWTMIEASGPTQAPGIWNDQPFAASLRYGGQHQQRLMANYDTPGFYSDQGPGSDCWNHSETKIPEGAWACMEWEFDSDAGQMRFWLDGAAIDDLTVGGEGQGCVHHDTMDQWFYPTMESVVVGWVDYQSGGGRELWIDDVAVGPARVGCD